MWLTLSPRMAGPFYDKRCTHGGSERTFLPKVSQQAMMKPEFAPFLSGTKFCAGSAMSCRASHFPPAPGTQDLRGSEQRGWWEKGYGMALCAGVIGWLPRLHPWTIVPADSIPGANPGILSPSHPTTRPSFVPRGSWVWALHLPQPGVVLGWGGRLGFDRQLSSWGCRPGPLLSSSSQLAPEGKRGWGQLHRETFVLAQNRHRLGTELPLGCHGDWGHLSSCLFSQRGFHGDNRH